MRRHRRPYLQRHGAGVGVPVAGRLGERALDDPVGGHYRRGRRRAPGAAHRELRYISMTVSPENAGFPASISNRMAPTAKRSEAGTIGSPSHCSGGHVPRRADDRAGGGEPGIGLELLSQRPGESKVEQLDAVRSEEDVRGLEVAVDDTETVERLQSREDTERDLERLGKREGPRVIRSASASPVSSSITRYSPASSSASS